MNFLERLFSEHRIDGRIYMDYAAATPLRHEAWEAMQPISREVFGNASAIHKEGQRARQIIEEAREKVARKIQVRCEDVIFTSGGTEANNLAIAGVIEATRHTRGLDYSDMEIITTAIEHPSILGVCKALEAQGVIVHEVPVDETGRIIVSELEKLLNKNTILVATALINSEIGVIQDTKKLKRIINERDKRTILMVDGAQAPLWVSCQLETLGADILTLDAGKFYGPKGVGAVVRRHGVCLSPITYGGGQESGIRPGTENPTLIVGFEVSFHIAQENYKRRSQGVGIIRDYFFEQIGKLPEAIINGSLKYRVANNINISIPGLDTEFASVVLDEHGVACSTKSACSGVGGGQSHVVIALSNNTARAKSTLRFTLGETSDKTEVDKVIEILRKHIDSMQGIV